MKKNKSAQKSKFLIIRALYFVGGLISLVLGCVGIALPILPTVPFFLLTTYLFAKSNKKFHDWFLNTKVYKKYMSGFAEHKSMSIGGELTLMLLVTGMLIVSCMLVKNVLAMAIVMPLLVATKYMYFIFKVKTVSKEELKALKVKNEIE